MASTSSNHLNFLAKVSEIYESALSPSNNNNDDGSQQTTQTIQPRHPLNRNTIKPRVSVSPLQPYPEGLGLGLGVPSADELITAAREFSGATISPTKRQRNWKSYVNFKTQQQQRSASSPQERLPQQPSKTSGATIVQSSSGYILVNGVPVPIPEGVEVHIPSPSAAGNNSSSHRHCSKQSAMKMKSIPASRSPLKKRGYQELSSDSHRYSHNASVQSNPSSYQPRRQQHSDFVDSIPRRHQASASSQTPQQDLSHPSPHTQKCNFLFQRLGQSGHSSEMATTTSLQLLLQHRRHNAVQRELADQKRIMGMGGPYRAYSDVLETYEEVHDTAPLPQPQQLLSAMPFSNDKQQPSPTTLSTVVSSNPRTTMMQRRHSKAATPSPTPQDPSQAFARFDSAGSSNTIDTQESTLPYCTADSSQLVLFRPCDKRKLNKLYYYIGNHILEAVPYSALYNSTIDESKWVARERNIQAYRKSVTQGLHFVCRYCRANNNAHVHIQSAVFSTKTVGGIYRRIPQFITKHVKSGACTSIPEDVRNKILDMKKTRAEVGNGEFEACLRSNGYRDTLGDVEHCVELVETEE